MKSTSGDSLAAVHGRRRTAPFGRTEEHPGHMRIPALFAGKSASALSRILRRGSGMTISGVIAERLHADLTHDLAAGLSDGAVVITGTNGKTTTSKMLGDMLADGGHRVVRNDTGSNMRPGITSAFVQAASLWGGSVAGDIAVLEVDEASMPAIIPQVTPRLICVTNLFRDQLDRYGDLDTIGGLIAEALASAPEATLLLNADDPVVAGLAAYATGPVRYFGIDDERCGRPASDRPIRDARCPECGSGLEYSRVFYDHLGDWSCPACGLIRPVLDFAARNVELDVASACFRARLGSASVQVALPTAGLHNVYNALAAAACGTTVGLSAQAAADSIGVFSAAFGRNEELDVDGVPITLLLAKNPTGAEQSLATALSHETPGALALALNDNAADGTDVSWIWDIDFESLDLSERSVVLSGGRAEDLAVRLKYAGVDPKRLSVSRDPASAVRALARLTPRGARSHVLATYTAMLEIRNAFAPTDDPLSALGWRLRHDA